MTVEEHPVGTELAMSNATGEAEMGFSGELQIGLEFDSADDALMFYTSYANRMGFKVRIGQLKRSLTDGSVSSRRFVCSKEGHQVKSRTGCPALIRVQIIESGKWVIDHFNENHNHNLEIGSGNRTLSLQQNGAIPINSFPRVPSRPRTRLLREANDEPTCPSIITNFKRQRKEELEGQPGIEPYIGQEFNSPDEAYQFYHAYAACVGFGIRIGQLVRSKNDGSVSARRFVCSKEGHQVKSRTGCKALIRVQINASGKWVIDHLNKNHNHNLEIGSGNRTPSLQQNDAIPINYFPEVPSRPRTRLLGEANDELEGQSITEPYIGQEFNSPDEAYQFYHAYAAYVGFGIRIGQLFRSKNDGSITSRRFVCSEEGFPHPSRLVCGAYLRIKRLSSGKWVVDHLEKDHNHDLDAEMAGKANCLRASDSLTEEVNTGLVKGDLFRIDNYPVPRGGRQNHIRSDWYNMLLDYFQSRQAEDTGFFYAMEVDNGNSMSIFWADGRSRYSCSLFGDVLVIDTSYRESDYLVPLATFVGVNHHKQPVLLGCALIADESEEAFTWLFQTWLRAMSGRQPLSVIADQDIAIQRAIAKVFPVTHHRFSLWQIKANEQVNAGLMGDGFTKDYEKCVYQSQTVDEFDTTWNALLDKYGLKDNARLKEMYEKRASWVPLYLKGSFFAGIPMNGSVNSFFGAHLNAQTPLTEFIRRYERGLEQRREEERKEDFNASNFLPFIRTKEPAEEQCRRLYTLAVFKIFQKELLECYSYLGLKIYEEGGLSRYLVHRLGDNMKQHVVTFNASNLSISCSCQMFEYEGVLCRHALRVFQILELKEVPSRYILHRWTRNAEDGVFPDIESWSSSQELNNLMMWSLRETASKYIDAGATSIEKYKLAYEILREGGRKLGWNG